MRSSAPEAHDLELEAHDTARHWLHRMAGHHLSDGLRDKYKDQIAKNTVRINIVGTGARLTDLSSLGGIAPPVNSEYISGDALSPRNVVTGA